MRGSYKALIAAVLAVVIMPFVFRGLALARATRCGQIYVCGGLDS
jgi:hypothetical protein